MNGENVTKVYVDSPIFTREDEERFRYVNPNVDDEDDEIFRFVPRDSLVGLKREREHDEHRPRDASNAAGWLAYECYDEHHVIYYGVRFRIYEAKSNYILYFLTLCIRFSVNQYIKSFRCVL